jgi:hypothetical protein
MGSPFPPPPKKPEDRRPPWYPSDVPRRRPRPPWEEPGPPPPPEPAPGDRGVLVAAVAALIVAGLVALAASFLRFTDDADLTLWETWKVADIAQALAAGACVAGGVVALVLKGRWIPLFTVTAGGLLAGIANWWSFPDLAGGAIVSGMAGGVAFFAGAAAAAAWPGVRGGDDSGALTTLRLAGAILAVAGGAMMATGLAKQPSTWGTGHVLVSNISIVLPCGLFAVALVLVRTRALAYLLLASGAAAVGYMAVPLLEVWAEPLEDASSKDLLLACGALVALVGGAIAAVGWPRGRPEPVVRV